MEFVFTPPAPVAVPVAGSTQYFPVRRIFCVGRNYAEHAREMGADAQADGREPPFFFSKPVDALVSGLGPLVVVYPLATTNLHHEVEMVVALAAGGERLTVDAAGKAIFGCAVGLDLTRRDLQAAAKAKGHPWDMGKGFDQSVVCGPLQPIAQCAALDQGRIWLSLGGQLRQQGDLAQMTWSVTEVISQLSMLVALAPGDLILTGTPAGVGPLLPGDVLTAGVAGLPELQVEIQPRPL